MTSRITNRDGSAGVLAAIIGVAMSFCLLLSIAYIPEIATLIGSIFPGDHK